MKMSKKLAASLAGLALVAGAMPAAVQAAEVSSKSQKLKGNNAPYSILAAAVVVGFVVLAASGNSKPSSNSPSWSPTTATRCGSPCNVRWSTLASWSPTPGSSTRSSFPTAR